MCIPRSKTLPQLPNVTTIVPLSAYFLTLLPFASRSLSLRLL